MSDEERRRRVSLAVEEERRRVEDAGLDWREVVLAGLRSPEPLAFDYERERLLRSRVDAAALARLLARDWSLDAIDPSVGRVGHGDRLFDVPKEEGRIPAFLYGGFLFPDRRPDPPLRELIEARRSDGHRDFVVIQAGPVFAAEAAFRRVIVALGWAVLDGAPSAIFASPRGWPDIWCGAAAVAGRTASLDLQVSFWIDIGHDIVGSGARLKTWQALFLAGVEAQTLARVGAPSSGWSIHVPPRSRGHSG